jgi:hypothetical protein
MRVVVEDGVERNVRGWCGWLFWRGGLVVWPLGMDWIASASGNKVPTVAVARTGPRPAWRMVQVGKDVVRRSRRTK